MIVKCPNVYFKKHYYVFNQLLNKFLGLKFELIFEDRTDYEFYLPFEPDKTLLISSVFFQLFNKKSFNRIKKYIENKSFKRSHFIISKEELSYTAIFGESSYILKNNQIILDFDIIGTSFFLLAQVEEVFSSSFDAHNRFTFKNSLLCENVYDYPVVDEYLSILKHCFKSLFGINKFKKRNSQVFITSDFDYFNDYRYKRFGTCFKSVIKSYLSNINLKFSDHFIPLIDFINHKILKKNLSDRYEDGINYFLNIAKDSNYKYICFIIPYTTHIFDGTDLYSLKQNDKQLKNIKNSNCLLGVHPGYDCAFNFDLMKKSISIFSSIQPNDVHCRMHFLRWNAKSIVYELEKCGVKYDYSLGFADYAGFRCGTSYEFNLFDWHNLRESNILEYPLICMDASVLKKNYQGFGFTELCLNRISKLSSLCSKYNGNFNLLWHNSELDTDFKRHFFCKILKKI